MVSRKRENKPKNGRSKPNFHSAPKIKKAKKSKSKSKSKPTKVVPVNANKNKSGSNLQPIAIESSSKELNFFLRQYQSANSIQLSSLELESISDACVVKLSESLVQDASTFGEHMKASFGASWKEDLFEKQLPEGKSEPGSPVLLTISLSALRSLELLRGLRSLTKECHAAKLFSKHMKVEEQCRFEEIKKACLAKKGPKNNCNYDANPWICRERIYNIANRCIDTSLVSLLKNHVNIACGTPSRIKKLIDMEALGLSRLAVVVLDMQPDVKGYSLFTLPQVRDELWDLYKSYFHPRLLVGNLRVCLYGTIPDTCQSRKMDE